MIAINNRFNIRYNPSNRWLGQVGISKGFVSFDTIEHGLRAGFILLRNYVYHLELNTVEKVINRFAPPSENNTCNYISYVSDVLRSNGFSPNHLRNNFELRYDKCFYYLVKAILKMETNYTLTYLEFAVLCARCNLQKPYVVNDENNS